MRVSLLGPQMPLALGRLAEVHFLQGWIVLPPHDSRSPSSCSSVSLACRAVEDRPTAEKCLGQSSINHCFHSSSSSAVCPSVSCLFVSPCCGSQSQSGSGTLSRPALLTPGFSPWAAVTKTEKKHGRHFGSRASREMNCEMATQKQTTASQHGWHIVQLF